MPQKKTKSAAKKKPAPLKDAKVQKPTDAVESDEPINVKSEEFRPKKKAPPKKVPPKPKPAPKKPGKKAPPKK